MTRTKKVVLNSLTAAIFSAVQISVGIVLPRLIIGQFGSSINGLTVSIQQFISYLSYLELGLASTYIYSLYKPLAVNNTNQVDALVTQAKKSYNKTSLFYLVGIIIVAVIYPFIANIGEIDLWVAITLIFVMGMSGLLEMQSLSKYRVLLTAHQNVYILNVILTISYIINFITAIVLIKLNMHILFIKAAPLLSLFLRNIFLHFYTNKKYPYLTFKSKEALTATISPRVNRFDTMLMEISKTIAYSLPVLALSILLSMKIVSIFSVYYLVFQGLQAIIGTITSGSTATFGELISRNENEKVIFFYDQFEITLLNTQIVLYSCAIVLIQYFIMIYTRGLPDADSYLNLTYAVIFTAWAYVDNFRLPAQTIIQAAGKFKEARIPNLMYLLAEVILLGCLTPFLGVVGALIAMTISSAIKTVWYIAVTNKAIISKITAKSIRRFIQGAIIIAAVFVLFHLAIQLPIFSIADFLLYGLALFFGMAIIDIAISLITDTKQTKDIMRRILSIFYKRRS
jgi:hypothetical protein